MLLRRRLDGIDHTQEGKLMTTPEKYAALERQIAEMSNRLGMLEDIHAVRTLHFKYGYYMDNCLFSEIVDLFADDSELRFLNGVFKGKEGARRLYGGATGLNGPVPGLLFQHLLLQDIVDVDHDRKTAKGRFRCFMQGGIHKSKKDAPERIPKQFFEAGVYENTYAKEDGVWKIKLFDYNVIWQANYDEGWANKEPGYMMVSAFEKTYPDDPRGPDEIREVPANWPNMFLVPFHYPNPVTGKWVK